MNISVSILLLIHALAWKLTRIERPTTKVIPFRHVAGEDSSRLGLQPGASGRVRIPGDDDLVGGQRKRDFRRDQHLLACSVRISLPGLEILHGNEPATPNLLRFPHRTFPFLGMRSNSKHRDRQNDRCCYYRCQFCLQGTFTLSPSHLITLSPYGPLTLLYTSTRNLTSTAMAL